MMLLEDMKVSVIIAENFNLIAGYLRTENRQLCPECGARMTVVDSHRESGVLFVWYGCSRKNCMGQWLKKINSTSSKTIKVI